MRGAVRTPFAACRNSVLLCVRQRESSPHGSTTMIQSSLFYFSTSSLIHRSQLRGTAQPKLRVLGCAFGRRIPGALELSAMITIKTASGRVTQVDATPATLVGDLKPTIQRDLGIPLSQQVLLFDGQVLDPMLSLGAQHVPRGGYLLVRMAQTPSRRVRKANTMPLLRVCLVELVLFLRAGLVTESLRRCWWPQSVILESFGLFVCVTLLIVLVAMVVRLLWCGTRCFPLQHCHLVAR